MDDKEKYALFANAVSGIAAALGGSVRRRPSSDCPWYATVELPEITLDLSARTWPASNGQLHVSVSHVEFTDVDGSKKRLHAHDYTRYGELKDNRIEINVALTKPPARIAADIKRRLLPSATPVWNAMLARAVDATDYTDATLKTAMQLAAALDKPREKGRTSFSSYSDGEGGHHLSVTAQGASVRFEAFNLPLDKALEIIALIKRQ